MIFIMAASKRREVAESVFNRNQRRKAEINEALKQETARREAVVKNMQRLRALRLERDQKAKGN
jgi:phosphopantothenate synthetase